ncbi:Arsenical resistance operon repressor [Enterobacter cloacae]|uniref:Arsenical resistance operon repressor n=1 Tax=Enterobacter cloacae TaxID=550 RepID=A0A377M974_ENTCL|nr:Arsenical resistance operon repressor [Enterobacter cloacae]
MFVSFAERLRNLSPKISRHLSMLRESGLLIDRREGKWIHYRLSAHMPAWAAAVIEQAYLSQKEDISLLAGRIARNSATTGGRAVCL